jgi:hypothetical protein
MPDDTILCWTWPEALQHLLTSPDSGRHVTVRDCKNWLAEGDKGRDKLAEFFRQRLRERYIEPVLGSSLLEENGFSIMALSCLLIETFETFRQGWESSGGRSALAFCYFFDREASFHDFRGYGRQFYEHVRCGILHQGETTGGWTIRLVGPLFEGSKLRVNTHAFHETLSEAIDGYRDELRRESAATEVWRNFRRKMVKTIKNCEAKP